jgi:hypothetical protein
MVMKKIAIMLLAISACLFLSGCGLMEMSFKAGFIMALILAAAVGLLVWIFHFSLRLIGRFFPAIRTAFEGFWDE